VLLRELLIKNQDERIRTIEYGRIDMVFFPLSFAKVDRVTCPPWSNGISPEISALRFQDIN
jgi:hypothetical protein